MNDKTGRIADKATASKLGNPKLQSLADEIKQAGVADQIKKTLATAKPGLGAKVKQAVKNVAS